MSEQRPGTTPASSLCEARPRYTAGVGTPVGVVFREFDKKHKSGLIITDSVVALIAEREGFTPEECELVTIVDNETGDLLWPRKEDK